MLVLALAGLLAILFAYYDSIGRKKNGLKWAYFIAFFVYAIHYDYGSDYMAYFLGYQEFIRMSIDQIMYGEVIRNNEIGWGLLNYMFKPLGKEGFLLLEALFGLFQAVLFYHLTKNYVERRWWPLAVFVFFFTGSIYPGSMSGIRQHLAVCITAVAFLVSLRVKSNVKALLYSLPMIYMATTIHTSALIMYPFMLVRFIPLEKIRIISILMLAVFLLLFLFQDYVTMIYDTILAQDENLAVYKFYQKDATGSVSLGLGFLINSIPFMLSLLFLYKNGECSDAMKRMVIISSLSIMLIPFQAIVPLISRIGYYFETFTVVSLPIIYSNIKGKTMRNSLLAIYVVFGLFQFYEYFHYDFWIHRFLVFKSLLSY